MTDKPHEACGVFGIYAPGEDVARIAYFAIYTLQHRGQESAGIATGDGNRISLHARMGLVAQVFSEEVLSGLSGKVAIGHNRYSTTGSSKVINAQPMLMDGPHGSIAVGHNGNLVNTASLRSQMVAEGHTFVTTSDTELIAKLFATSPGADWIERIRASMKRMRGAYSVVAMTEDALFVVRDPWGVRPLCLGNLKGRWVVASETCALDTIGADFVRDVEPGEIIRIDANGLHSEVGQPSPRLSLCIFEFIYFARPDSVVDGRLLYLAREDMGSLLAREYPVDADLVIGVPDSATAAGIGYARESGIPFSEGLIKSRYIGRTFIQPEQRLREVGINLKFNPMAEVLRGKRVVVVDDSIVRGTTTRPIVRLLRRAGAREVHVRISSPPYSYSCVLGVDTARRNELIAARMSVPEIERYIEADSLGYLSRQGLLAAIGRPSHHFCQACFTGEYPMLVESDVDKLALERT
ncbi:MAG: amidophosphoribosyltransferase [Dehalococcoidales bacterium]|nr:amidophosphoribosyltransferase [Dehalococcoidales bacterium]